MITLATLNTNHRYFKKDYVPSVMESRKLFGNMKDIQISDSDEEDIKVHDDFFDDLP